MADPVGVALGVAGLLGLFNTCVELVDGVRKGCNHGKDVTIISVKFEAEHARLLLWGESAGLWSSFHPVHPQAARLHPNLGRPDVFHTVRRALGTLHNLFHDAAQILQKYGAPQSTTTTALVPVANNADTLSDFFQAGQDEETRSKNQQREVRLGRSISWAFRDREVAESLIKNLHEFNDLLSNIVPVSSSTIQPFPSHFQNRSSANTSGSRIESGNGDEGASLVEARSGQEYLSFTR